MGKRIIELAINGSELKRIDSIMPEIIADSHNYVYTRIRIKAPNLDWVNQFENSSIKIHYEKNSPNTNADYVVNPQNQVYFETNQGNIVDEDDVISSTIDTIWVVTEVIVPDEVITEPGFNVYVEYFYKNNGTDVRVQTNETTIEVNNTPQEEGINWDDDSYINARRALEIAENVQETNESLVINQNQLAINFNSLTTTVNEIIGVPPSADSNWINTWKGSTGATDYPNLYTLSSKIGDLYQITNTHTNSIDAINLTLINVDENLNELNEKMGYFWDSNSLYPKVYEPYHYADYGDVPCYWRALRFNIPTNDTGDTQRLYQAWRTQTVKSATWYSTTAGIWITGDQYFNAPKNGNGTITDDFYYPLFATVSPRRTNDWKHATESSDLNRLEEAQHNMFIINAELTWTTSSDYSDYYRTIRYRLGSLVDPTTTYTIQVYDNNNTTKTVTVSAINEYTPLYVSFYLAGLGV